MSQFSVPAWRYFIFSLSLFLSLSFLHKMRCCCCFCCLVLYHFYFVLLSVAKSQCQGVGHHMASLLLLLLVLLMHIYRSATASLASSMHSFLSALAPWWWFNFSVLSRSCFCKTFNDTLNNFWLQPDSLMDSRWHWEQQNSIPIPPKKRYSQVTCARPSLKVHVSKWQ